MVEKKMEEKMMVVKMKRRRRCCPRQLPEILQLDMSTTRDKF